MVTPIIRLLGSEASVNSSGSNIGLNKLVRVYNQNDTDVVITVKNSDGTVTIGTVTVKTKDTVFINKAGTDVISAATACKMVAVAF